MSTSRSIGGRKADKVAISPRVARALLRNSVLAAVVAVVYLASGTPLFGQGGNNGTASLGVTVAPAVQLTTDGSTTVSLWIRLGTGSGYLWGDSTNTCTSPIGTATTYTISGKYDSIPFSTIPFTSSNTFVCAYDPGASPASVHVDWPHIDTSLRFGTQPSNTVSGASISPAVTVQVLDNNGVVDTSSTASIQLAIGTNAGSGTLSGTLTQSAVNGVATFNNLSIDKAATGYTLTAASSGLTSATSSAFNITSGTATHLVYTTVPSTGVAGTAFSVTVQSQDANGNPASPTSNTTITLSKATGGGALSGTLTGTILTSGNSVTISTPIYSKADTMTLTATASAGVTSLTPITSGNIVFSAGTATKLVFTATPGNTTGGVAFGTQPVVTVEDANGNTVTGSTAPITLAIGTNPSGGTLTCTTNPQNATSGIDTFVGCNINKVGSGFTLTAASSGLTSGTSSAFNITLGPAAQLAFTTQPGGGAAAAAWSQQPAVTVEDAGGNTVTTSSASIQLAIGTNPGGGTLSCTVNPKNAVSGVDTFAGCKIDLIGTGYTLTAASSGLSTATSNPLNITVGAAAKLAFTSTPITCGYSTSFPCSPEPVVTVEDAGGNRVTTSSASISISGSTNNIHCDQGSDPTMSAVAGVASFTNCFFNSHTGPETLTATSSGLTSATSGTFTMYSAAAVVVFTQQPTGAAAGATIAPPVTVQLQDGSGDNVLQSGVNITLSLSTGTGTLSGTLTQATNSSGLATFNNLSINLAGSKNLKAVSTGLTQATSSAFTITAGTASASLSTVTASPASVVANGTSTSTITVTMKDASGNLENGDTVTLAQGSGGSTITPASGTTNASGVATFTVKDSTAEVVTYTATDTTDSVAITQTAQVTFTASQLSITQVNGGANPTAGTAFSVVIQSQDANGNAAKVVANTAVTLSRNTGTGTLGGTLTGTIAAGTNSVTISGVTYTKAESGVILTATRTSGDALTADNSAAFTVDPGAVSASTSTVNPSPASVVADGSTTSTITVTLKDANSNPVSGKTVTLGQASGSSTISAASGPSSSTGVVTFTVTDMKAETVVYTATDTTDSNLAISDTATVTFTASKLAIITGPFTITAGNCISSAATVQTQDGNGTATKPASSVTVTLSSSSTGTKAFYSNSGCGTTITTLTISTSVNSANFWYKDTQAGSPVITATATGLTSATQTETVNAATATHLVYSTVPSTGTAGTAFSVTVQSQDANGNPSSPTSTTTITLSKVTGGGTLSGTLTGSIPTSDNSVTISTPVYSAADTMTLRATATAGQTGLTSITSGNIVFSAGTATQLVFTASPSTSTGGVAFGTQPVVALEDANGNIVTGTAQNVTLSIQNNAGGGTLSGTTSAAVNTATGLATFSGLSINTKGTGYTLTATGSTVDTTGGVVVSNAFNINVGAAAKLAFTTQPGGGAAQAAWLQQPAVTVQDAGGNTVTTSSASITLAIGTNPGGGALNCTANPKAATSGVATFAGCNITPGGTGYTLKATSGTLTLAASSTFDVQDFTLSSSPSSGSESRAGGVLFTYSPGISLTSLGGFGGTVSLTCSSVTPTIGTPITCSDVTFGNTTISGSTASTVTVTAGSGTRATSYTITISGTATGLPARTVILTFAVAN